MTRNNFILALGTLLIAVLMSIPSPAQSGGGCWHFGTGFVPPFPLYTFDCAYMAYSYSWDCKIRDICPPPAASRETYCASCAAAAAGHPIALATGDTYIEENDISVPGLGGGLALNRIWNSLWPATQLNSKVGLFGPNWRSSFEERVFSSGDGYVKYARRDGSFWSFAYTGSNNGTGWTTAAPANVPATLIQGSSSWSLTFQNGEQRLFDMNSGNLTSIIDRNGNTTQIVYDAIGRLVTVTDPAGRHLYFGYANNSSYLITGVTSDFGISLSYTYDSQGRLTQVTKPDQTTINFEYDANSFISAVKDTSGKVLESHTYDSSGHGLSSSRANGVDSVTVSYPKQ